jgi:hypothetical protein
MADELNRSKPTTARSWPRRRADCPSRRHQPLPDNASSHARRSGTPSLIRKVRGRFGAFTLLETRAAELGTKPFVGPPERALAGRMAKGFLRALPDLPARASGCALGVPVCCRVTPPRRPSIRFLFVRSELRLRLPSYPASRRRSCPWLAVPPRARRGPHLQHQHHGLAHNERAARRAALPDIRMIKDRVTTSRGLHR